VKVLPRPILSVTSAPGISESQTLLLTMDHMAWTLYASNFILGMPGIEFVWPGTWSSVSCFIGWAISILTASLRHSWACALLSVLRMLLTTELELSELSTSLAMNLLLNLSRTLFGLLFVLNHLFQLVRGKLGWCAGTRALLNYIIKLGISQTSIWTQSICGI